MIPEHDPVEILAAEPQQSSADTGAPPEAHTHAPPPGERPTAREVILGAIAVRLPCPTCGREEPCRCIPPAGYDAVSARADLVAAALILYGYLPDPKDADEPFDPEAVAQWLASRTAFPRYTAVTDGWRRLLEAETDVELAAIKALQRVDSSEVENVKSAKAALLAWHQQQRM